jgi:hypothetical protein
MFTRWDIVCYALVVSLGVWALLALTIYHVWEVFYG